MKVWGGGVGVGVGFGFGWGIRCVWGGEGKGRERKAGGDVGGWGWVGRWEGGWWCGADRGGRGLACCGCGISIGISIGITIEKERMSRYRECSF